MGLSLVTAPASEPVTLAEAKIHLGVDGTEWDTYIPGLIIAARKNIENITRRRLVQQTWDYTLPWFPVDAILLPNLPVSSVTFVNYVNSAGATVSFSSGASPDLPLYDVETDGPRAKVFPKFNVSWPITRDHGNAVTVRYIAGYEPATDSPIDHAANVPGDLKEAIKLMIGDMFENREGKIVGTMHSTNPTVNALLSPYIMRGF